MVWSPKVLTFRSKHTMEAFSGEDFARKKVVFLGRSAFRIMGLMGHYVVSPKAFSTCCSLTSWTSKDILLVFNRTFQLCQLIRPIGSAQQACFLQNRNIKLPRL